MKITNTRKVQASGAIFAALALTLAGCAGSAGAGASAQGDSEGFEYGASQDNVDAALADLEPVTLSYQPAASSKSSMLGQSAMKWKNAIEERSGGKITIDVVWGQAIASYAEIDDALADGRLDLGFTVPGYDPAAYPAYNAVSTVTTGFPNSPIVGNAVTGAVMAQIGYDNDVILQEFEEKGLTALNPFSGTSPFYTFCTGPIESPDDWNGLQLRAGSQPHHTMLTEMGAAPSFMEFTETYEALQRGTLNCEMGRVTSAVENGLFEVAPHMGYTDADTNFTNMAVGSLVAGSTFTELPVAYQQLIFDSLDINLAESIRGTADASDEAVKLATDEGGSVKQYDDETLATVDEINQDLRDQVAAEGLLPDGFASTMDQMIVDWTATVEELGYADGGDLEDIGDWYNPETDWAPVSDAVFAQVFLPHRPA